MKLADVILTPGSRANQPAANTVPVGALYYVTDEDRLERSNGVTWDEYAAPPGGGGSGGSGLPNFSLRTINAYYPSFTSGTPVDVAIGGPPLSEAGSQSAVVAGGNLILNYTSQASAGSEAGFRVNTFSAVRPVLNPDITIVFRTPSDMTDVRIWVGFTSTAPTNSDDIADEGAAFRYSTVAGDAGWTPVTRDGATQNVGSAIGLTPVADTVYRLRIRTIDSGTTWKFSVNASAEQDVTTNVPQPNENMGWGCRVFAVTNSARNIGLVRVHLEFGEDFS